MEQVEKLTYQGIAPWMIWVAVLVTIAACVGIAAVWKVVQISREEKKRKDDNIKAIAKHIVEISAPDIIKTVVENVKPQFDLLEQKMDEDKKRIEEAEKRSEQHDKALERIEKTLESVDKNIQDISEGFTFLARGTIASINHLRENGTGDMGELEEASRELSRYLTKRPVVPI